MNNQQQIKALMAVIDGWHESAQVETLKSLVTWIVDESLDGRVSFSLEDFVEVLFDE